jgi:hypothetical protein
MNTPAVPHQQLGTGQTIAAQDALWRAHRANLGQAFFTDWDA